jgi:RNA polymerase primary sigma factor
MVKRRSFVLRPLAAAAALTACGCAAPVMAFTASVSAPASHNKALHYQTGAGDSVLDYAPATTERGQSSQVRLVPTPPGLKKSHQQQQHPQIEFFILEDFHGPGSITTVTPTRRKNVALEKSANVETNVVDASPIALVAQPKAKVAAKRVLKKRRKIKRASPMDIVHEVGVVQHTVKSSISVVQHTVKPSISEINNAKKKEKLHETGRLISAVREFRRVTKVREGLAARADFAPISDADWASALDSSVPIVELRDIIQAGREARETLIAQNEGLVMQIAKRYESKNVLGSALTLQDMIQEGKMGVLEAAERFDVSKGYQFSTYATYWIRQRILRCLTDHSRTIRLPAHVHSIVSQMHRQRESMTHEIGRPPSLPELAHRMNISVEKLKMYSERSRNVISLENPLNMNGGSYRGSVAVDDNRKVGDYVVSDSPGPQDCAEQDALRSALQGVMENGLSPRERHVLTLRYGLADGSPRTLEETARELQVSKDRIRSIESKALNKLRCPGMNYKLKHYVDTYEEDKQKSDFATSLSSLEESFSSSRSSSGPKRNGKKTQSFDPFALDSRWSFL